MVGLMGCDTAITSSEEAAKEITYFKDMRTGLCFGQMTSVTYYSFYINSITCVPCDSVKHLLRNK